MSAEGKLHQSAVSDRNAFDISAALMFGEFQSLNVFFLNYNIYIFFASCPGTFLTL